MHLFLVCYKYGAEAFSALIDELGLIYLPALSFINKKKRHRRLKNDIHFKYSSSANIIPIDTNCYSYDRHNDKMSAQ